MIKGYQYQSDFARGYVAEGRAEGRGEAREGVRRAVIEAVSSRWPALRGELMTRLRDLTEAVLGQIAVELGAARSEGGIRTVLDRRLGRPKPKTSAAQCELCRRTLELAVAGRRGRREDVTRPARRMRRNVT